MLPVQLNSSEANVVLLAQGGYAGPSTGSKWELLRWIHNGSLWSSDRAPLTGLHVLQSASPAPGYSGREDSYNQHLNEVASAIGFLVAVLALMLVAAVVLYKCEMRLRLFSQAESLEAVVLELAQSENGAEGEGLGDSGTPPPAYSVVAQSELGSEGEDNQDIHDNRPWSTQKPDS